MARKYGIIDPLTFLARFRQFAQPSEVQEPIELIRAGIAFHARGLINTKAIQHNLDWVWPYWVERQFNPNDTSFIPRAFSFSHINLTHRNWTSVGHPDLPLYPIVDPKGLITPLFDGWSIDLWLVSKNGNMLLPSRLGKTYQRLILTPNLAVETISLHNGMELQSYVTLNLFNNNPYLDITVTGRDPEGGWLVAALRPYNPEGIQFIENIKYKKDDTGWLVNSHIPVKFDKHPEKYLFSNYNDGDVIHKLNESANSLEISCDVGMATSAVLFPFSGNQIGTAQLQIPLNFDLPKMSSFPRQHFPCSITESWDKALSHVACLEVPDKKIQFLFDAAIRTLILLSADEIVPGPYTYRRFWFRDACLMLNGLMTMGLTDRAYRILDGFPKRQKITGYFQSQEGEWDSNGQVLWIMDRFQQLTGHQFNPSWIKAVDKGAEWINRKRISKNSSVPHAGLFPPGFSAEHLGPNDYYYWDNIWGVAGLRGAARLAGIYHSTKKQRVYEANAVDFEQNILNSIDTIPQNRSLGGIPASPYRRMDAGAIGSIVADYPLQLTPPGNNRILKTIDFLLKHCFHKGAFFQDMIHSGINIYLTLGIAQTLLRNGDDRYQKLIRAVVDLASPTGQWPEAIHPITHGGCMGDGQHGWAAAEWLMMIRKLFVREEGETLILGSGILPEWTSQGLPVSFGPTKTSFGNVKVRLSKNEAGNNIKIAVKFSNVLNRPSNIIINVPGYKSLTVENMNQDCFILEELQT